LRTPLAVIRACMHARPPAYEQTIDQECARMGRLIEDLLTLSRLETISDQNGQLLERQDVDLDTLLLTAYEQMELLAVQKKIRLELNLPQEALPHIQGDCHKLEQLLSILLQNALSYTPAGGKVILSAEVSRHMPNRVRGNMLFPGLSKTGGSFAIHICVMDNGPGISDADKAHIFERFYRAQRSHTDRSHFGLGLCIAQEIAHAHGATLTVADTEGGGATFHLMLER
ncbi:MAG: sensor histidine kinase, partial [Acetatifactor sp.]|nr:sensor histidine kinase [Acetatifactor sp.]